MTTTTSQPEPGDPTQAGDVPAATPPPAAASTATGTSTGLDPKVAGLLAYLFGWISGLILLLVEKEHKEVRFHAAQSILVSIAFIAVYLALSVVMWIPVIGLIAIAGYAVVGLAGLALWIYLLIQGYQLNHLRLPVVGQIAEQWAAP